jgi:hypothetical protein
VASYDVGGHDWPRGDPDTDLTPAEVMAVLTGLDEYWEPAMQSLEEKP